MISLTAIALQHLPSIAASQPSTTSGAGNICRSKSHITLSHKSSTNITPPSCSRRSWPSKASMGRGIRSPRCPKPHAYKSLFCWEQIGVSILRACRNSTLVAQISTKQFYLQTWAVLKEVCQPNFYAIFQRMPH